MAHSSGKHTLILVQHTSNFQSRTYMDFPTVGASMDAIVQMYEHKLRELNPSAQHITYDVSQLHAFVDSLYDIVALVFDRSSGGYLPHDKEWIKGKVFRHLSDQAR